jgi:hypothetical protein
MMKITLAILLTLFCLVSAVSQDQQPPEIPPLLTFADLQKNDPIEGPFRIAGYVIDAYKCPPCPAGAMCKPCLGDHIVVTDNIDEKDPALIKRLRIFTDQPEQCELKKQYLFTVKVRGKILKGQPIHDVDLLSFAEMPDSSTRIQ